MSQTIDHCSQAIMSLTVAHYSQVNVIKSNKQQHYNIAHKATIQTTVSLQV
jgi:hypothetical protein